MTLRLIASDLDGTLLRSDGTLSPRTKAAIAAAQAAGVVVVFATARPPRVMRELAEAAGLTGLVVCANGAMIYDVKRDALVHHERLDAELARAFTQRLLLRAPGVVFAAEDGDDLNFGPDFPHLFGDLVDDVAIRLDDVEALFDNEVTRLLVHHPEQDADMLAAWIAAEVGVEARVTHSGGPFVEIGVVGVSKASGVERLCRDLGIDGADVVAFGDAPNDVEMLRFAGLGVAVANAHPETLAAADEVAPSNDDDGVAQVIERLLAARA